jgi:hypothetical protein
LIEFGLIEFGLIEFGLNGAFAARRVIRAGLFVSTQAFERRRDAFLPFR